MFPPSIKFYDLQQVFPSGSETEILISFIRNEHKLSLDWLPDHYCRNQLLGSVDDCSEKSFAVFRHWTGNINLTEKLFNPL